MRKKETEKYIKKVAEEHINERLTPEIDKRMWEKIQTAVISEPVQQKKKKQTLIRYSVISCAAACAVLVISLIAMKQYIFGGAAPITGDTTLGSSTKTQTTKSSTIPTVSEVLPPITSIPSGAESVPPIEILPQNIIVISHRIYQYKGNINEKDIDKVYSEIVGGTSERIYSLHGKKLESALALKTDDVYQYYECVYGGIFSFDGKKYQIEDNGDSQIELSEQKGKYLGESEGLKLYEFSGRDNVILVDISPLLDTVQTENLVAAVEQE